MKTRHSKIFDQIIETKRITLGELHFFENFVIAEFDEGIHVDFNSAIRDINVIKNFYGEEKPFGFISNRVNSYSFTPIDSDKFKNVMKNLSAYSVVSYSEASQMNANIEKSFCKEKDICFNNLYDAVNWIDVKLFSSN